MKLLVVLITLALANSLTNNQIINQVLYAVFEENQLPKPVFCLDCFDDASAKKLVLFLDDILPRISKVLPPFLHLKKEIVDYFSNSDGAVWSCLSYSYEIQNLGEKYHIGAGGSLEDIEHYFIKYFQFHYPKAHNHIKTSNELWQKKSYRDFGTLYAKFVHEVIDHDKVQTPLLTSE